MHKKRSGGKISPDMIMCIWYNYYCCFKYFSSWLFLFVNFLQRTDIRFLNICFKFFKMWLLFVSVFVFLGILPEQIIQDVAKV